MRRFKRLRLPRYTTVIGRDTEVAGDLSFSGGLHLDGLVHGNVVGAATGGATLIVSEHGRIRGDVRVENLILNGVVEGDVHVTQRAELASEARVSGALHYRWLEMAMGAEVNGQLLRTGEGEGGGEGSEAAPLASGTSGEVPVIAAKIAGE